MEQCPIRLDLPAEAGYLVVVRAAVASSCSQLGFTLEELEDFKLAVNEAASLLMSDVSAAERLHVAIGLGQDDNPILTVSVAARTNRGRAPRQDSFAWTVLTALAKVTASASDDGIVQLTLTAQRGPVPT